MDKKIFSSIGVVTHKSNKIITQEFLLQYKSWIKFEFSICSDHSGDIDFFKFNINDIINYDTLKVWDKFGNYVLFDYNKTNGSFIVVEEKTKS